MAGGQRNEETTRRSYLKFGTAMIGSGLFAGCTSILESGDDSTAEVTPASETPADGATDRDGSPSETDGTTDDPTDDGTTTDTASEPFPENASVSHDPTEWDRYDPDWRARVEAPPDDGYEVEVLVENLEIPWDLAFGPSGELFVTERTGRILKLEAGELQTITEPETVIDAGSIEPGSDESSWQVPGGEGGLLGIAVHPTFPEPPLVYAYFTTDPDVGRENRVVAYDVTADDPASRSWTIIEGIPADTYHNGGRIAFGPANYLWVTTGDGDPGRDHLDRTRDPGSLAGKILRVRPDGEAPADNPDIGPDADPRVYTYGHRNPQGISWLPDATPIITEHGPTAGDEVTVLRPGANCGWPDVRNNREFPGYAGADAHPPVADAATWAPSGCVFYTGDGVPTLRNRLVFGGLISQQVTTVTVARADDDPLASEHETIHEESWYDGDYQAASQPLFEDVLGRVRHVEQGPDGALYAITSNRDGRASGEFPTERDDVLVRILTAES